MTCNDNLDRLAKALYGREANAQEFLGGSDAKILLDAAVAIERGTTLQVARLQAQIDAKAGTNYIHLLCVPGYTIIKPIAIERWWMAPSAVPRRIKRIRRWWFSKEAHGEGPAPYRSDELELRLVGERVRVSVRFDRKEEDLESASRRARRAFVQRLKERFELAATRWPQQPSDAYIRTLVELPDPPRPEVEPDGDAAVWLIDGTEFRESV